jgi:hypothetical protein
MTGDPPPFFFTNLHESAQTCLTVRQNQKNKQLLFTAGDAEGRQRHFLFFKDRAKANAFDFLVLPSLRVLA